MIGTPVFCSALLIAALAASWPAWAGVAVRIILGAIAFCGLATAATTVVAGGSDYVFVPVTKQVALGKSVPIEVRLLDRAGRPVAGAVITRARLDMAPDGMALHVVKATLEPSVALENYRFNADLEMAGRWQLSLVAKVAGEPETVTGKVLFVVSP